MKAVSFAAKKGGRCVILLFLLTPGSSLQGCLPSKTLSNLIILIDVQPVPNATMRLNLFWVFIDFIQASPLEAIVQS